MKPPSCSICDLDFRDNPKLGGSITFKLSEEEIVEQRKLCEQGWVGHPTGDFYFCNKHLAIAEKYKNLPWQEAMDAIRKECEESVN